MKTIGKKLLAALLTLALLVGAVPSVFAADNVEPFTDVKTDAWYAEFVEYVYKNEWMKGVSETTFEPNGNCTRAMAATVLHRMAGEPAPDAASTFTDLTANWYKNAVAWAQENDIVNGVSATSFHPNGILTREQLVTMIWRYYGAPKVAEDHLKAFPDADQISVYAKEAFNWAISKEIISGDNGKLVPKGNATRAQFAKIITVFCKLPAEDCTHTWGTPVATTSAACTEAGVNTFTCTLCGETKTEPIAALGHIDDNSDGVCDRCNEPLAQTCLHTNLTAVPMKAATCTEAGNFAYWKCDACGKYFSDAAAQHEIGADDMITEKAPHTPVVIPAVPAVCNATGLTEGSKCSVCGTILTAQEEVAIDPDAHIDENEDLICDRCNADLTPPPVQYLAIYNAGASKAMTTENSVYNGKDQLATAYALLDGEKLYSEAANLALFEVITAEGTTTFKTEDGKYLYADGTHVRLADEEGEFTKFLLEEVSGGCFIKCATVEKYLEYYSNVITLYDMNTTKTAIYTFSFVEFSPCEHAWDAGTVTTEPTCLLDGVKTYACTNCPLTKTETVSKLGHLDEDGDEICDRCEEDLRVFEFVLAAEIKDGDEVVIYNANAKKAASSVMFGSWALRGEDAAVFDGVITGAGETLVWTVKVNEDGSYSFYQGELTLSVWLSGTYVEISNDPQYDNTWTLESCNKLNNSFYLYSSNLTTSYGKAYLECYSKIVGNETNMAFCGYSTRSASETNYGFQFYVKGGEPIAPCAHAICTIVGAKEATCTTAGNIPYWKCTECGKYFSDAERKTQISFTDTQIAALGHDWQELDGTTVATCTEDGVANYECARCNETKTETTAALGHSWNEGETTTAATCTAAGVKTFTCSRCGGTKTEPIPKLDHVDENPEDDKCDLCGASMSGGNAFGIATSIAAGDQIVLVASHGGKTYAMNNDGTSIERALRATEITVTDNTVTPASDAIVWTVIAGSADGTFVLKSAAGEYIAHGGGSWLELSTAGTDLTITCGAGTSMLAFADSRRIVFNNPAAGPQFRAYQASSSTGTYSQVLTIYKKN